MGSPLFSIATLKKHPAVSKTENINNFSKQMIFFALKKEYMCKMSQSILRAQTYITNTLSDICTGMMVICVDINKIYLGSDNIQCAIEIINRKYFICS